MAKRRQNIIISMLFMVLGAIVLGACGGGIKSLSTPLGLKVTNEDILVWEAVENASEYEVDINGTEYMIQTNSLDLFELITSVGTYEIKIKAYGDPKKYDDSEWSDNIEYVIYNNLISYEPIDGSDISAGYMVAVLDKSAIKGKVIIPEYINDIPVKKIYEEAFSGCRGMTGVIIPDSVTKIPINAFSDCKLLSRVKLPAGISELDISNFGDCPLLREIVIPDGIGKIHSVSSNKIYVEKIIFPESLSVMTGIGNWAGLKEIYIPKNVVTISPGFFANAVSLTGVEVSTENAVYKSDGNCILRKDDNSVIAGCKTSVIPGYAQKIGKYAFYALGEDFKTLYIPASVTEIDKQAVQSCVSLEQITVDKNNPIYKSEGNCVIKTAENTLVVGTKASVIPDYITKIGDYSFRGQSTMTEIKLPTGLTDIGGYAFLGCEGLTQIFFPLSVTSIGEGAFCGCVGLTSVIIPKGVTKIEKRTFYNCINIENIFLPQGLTEIGSYAFACISDDGKVFSNIKSITFPDSLEVIDSGAFISGTVYISQSEYPSGWFSRQNNPFALFDWIDLNAASIFKGCDIRYDVGYPYVNSFTYINYKIEQNSEGINIVIPATILSSGELNNPVRIGYKFEGWTTDAESSTAEYETFPSASERKSIPDGTVFYALWQPETA